MKLVEPEGTYLVWLNMIALKLDETALENLIFHKAKLWLDGGTMFGQRGVDFQRLNIACPVATLEKVLIQLEEAVKSQYPSASTPVIKNSNPLSSMLFTTKSIENRGFNTLFMFFHRRSARRVL